MMATDVKHRIATPEEWLKERKQLLDAEKAFTRQRDEISRRRRELPWVPVEKSYIFDGPRGKETLADLFAGRGQLIIYHFMFGPGWEEGCRSCSFLADHFDGSLIHLAHRDVTLAVSSRAPYPQIAAFQKRMGWRFPWVSSYGSDFNHDYHVSFTKEELASGTVEYNYAPAGFPVEEAPGVSVFAKDEAGKVFHTYSTYGRGLDILLGPYNWLDMAPKGRDEEGLAFSMSWVRHHDKYSDGDTVDAAAGYQQPKVIDAPCCSGAKP
jgi:predicted dithiol-disulfide oxidoreductase (DUF899 family)